MLTVSITGVQRLRQAAQDLHAAPSDLRREVVRALGGVPEILLPPVRREIATVMPRRYAPILAGALEVRVSSLRSGWVRVRVRGQARGRKNLRDLAAMDIRGILRHPVFGRVAKGQPWHNTAIRTRVWSRPVEAETETIMSQVDAACGRVAANLERG